MLLLSLSLLFIILLQNNQLSLSIRVLVEIVDSESHNIWKIKVLTRVIVNRLPVDKILKSIVA